MSAELTFAELENQHAELLPARTLLQESSLDLNDPFALLGSGLVDSELTSGLFGGLGGTSAAGASGEGS